MTLSEALGHLRRLAPTFTTKEAAGALDVEPPHASVILSRLSESGHVQRLAQGRWVFPGRLEPFAVPEALTRPLPSYVSLQSALYHHGMIDQIPDLVYAVSLGPTRRIATPVATVSLHRVSPEFFFGFERSPRIGANIATPEKALVDFFYFRPARSRLFRALPELDIPRQFSVRRARAMLLRIRSEKRRSLVGRLLEGTLERRGR